MKWTGKFHEEFEAEFKELDPDVQDEFFAEAEFVEDFGPETSRPHVNTLKGFKYPNMKELRFEAADGEWRAAFVFDPKRQAIVLVAADKSGVSEKKFYKRLIDKADGRYGQHLEKLKAEDKAAEKAAAAKKAVAKPETKKGKKR